ncbi:MAG: glycosyltransferase family 2 protein [Candidatus Handelsmanbacteria bacterium]|nr:glycosyltransferase family 2 protein [Candidatus Handelsmanbacteria bacterium]
MSGDSTEEFKVEGISLVIPAYREELAIAGVIEEYRQKLESLGYPYEIIVVDDASPDRTAELAMKAGARVIRHPRNRGGGAARKTGIKAACWDAVLITDGDGTYPADALGEIIDRLRYAHMVVGARVAEKGTFKPVRWIAKWLIRRLACFLASTDIPDLNSGLRLVRRDLALRFSYLLPNGHSWVSTITLSALTNDLRVDFVPVNYRLRQGKSSFHPIRDTYNYFLTVVRTVTYFNPLKVFMPASILLLALGTGTLIHGVVRGDVYESSMLVTIAGLLTFFFGLLADQNARMRTELEHHRRAQSLLAEKMERP